MEREVGGGIGMGNTCKPLAVSFQCMTKSTTNKKKKKEKKKKKKNIFLFMFFKCAIYVKSIISPSVVAVRSPSRVLHGSSQPHGLQHASPACSSPSLEICPSSCPLNQ